MNRIITKNNDTTDEDADNESMNSDSEVEECDNTDDKFLITPEADRKKFRIFVQYRGKCTEESKHLVESL